MRARTLTAAYLLDWVLGDPETLPHPVRAIGRAIELGEVSLRRIGEGPTTELIGGVLLTGTVVLGSAIATSKLIHTIKARSPSFGRMVEIWLGANCLATRNLLDEASEVLKALESSRIDTARQRLARIVGRDTGALSENEIARALIETLAESLCDGIIAPLLYLTVGGVPLAIAYKATNTLDSMIGHRDTRYEWFGKFAARLDDAANFVPSRVAATLICGSATLMDRRAFERSCTIWRHDARKHASPNAGQTESAMAGALGVQLGGVNTYAGERIETPLLGAGYPKPDSSMARRAMRITAVASLLGFALGCLALSWRRNG
jgi:adenosylcobinamide-phosphate synthase